MTDSGNPDAWVSRVEQIIGRGRGLASLVPPALRHREQVLLTGYCAALEEAGLLLRGRKMPA